MKSTGKASGTQLPHATPNLAADKITGGPPESVGESTVDHEPVAG